jgi:perosamine synthetase
MEKYPRQIGVGGLKLSAEEKRLVNQVLDSNQLTYGPVTKEFERKFAHAHDCAHGLFMNSGTSALHVALAALKAEHGWSDGDEILVPAVTFVATCNVVLHNNLMPVFVDVEPDTYNLDPLKMEEKITKRTRGVIPVHLLGLPASMDPILSLAETYQLAVVEDSCESMFAKYKGKSVGSIGDIGCFSTYVAHFLVTGVGGFATSNDERLAATMRSLMNHGRDGIYIGSTDDEGLEGEELNEVIRRRFRFVNVGHSFRCTELEAAIGLGQLGRSDQIVERRREIAQYMNGELQKYSDEIQLPMCPDDRSHSYMLYGMTMKNQTKWEMVKYLENRNVETRDLLPLINQPIYKRMFGDLEREYPIAKKINESGFYIGCHSYLSDHEVEFIVESVSSFFDK